MDVKQLVNQLTDKDNVLACAACDSLVAFSADSPDAYEYMDTYFELLGHKNSLVRNRALALIAANAKWDREDKIPSAINLILCHITDEKPITARQCIKALTAIVEAKPSLRDPVVTALTGADTSAYADSMRPLVEKDISATLKILF